MQRFLIYLFLQTLYMFQRVPPPIIRSTQLYKQLQVLLTNTTLLNTALLRAPDDGRRNRLTHVQRL